MMGHQGEEMGKKLGLDGLGEVTHGRPTGLK
jgi:hypothetical protein